MHKIYSVQITQFGPHSLVVTASYENGNSFRGESFCVFPSPHEAQDFKAFSVPKSSFEGMPVALDEAFVLDEALAQAKIDIKSHLEANYSNKPFVLPPGHPPMVEQGIGLLVHLRLRSTADYLWSIRDRTGEQELRGLLDRILNLPEIKVRPL